MSFIPRFDTKHQVTALAMAVSSTITKYDALEWASGYLQRADSSTTEVLYVALEGKVTGDSDNTVISVVRTDWGAMFEADTNAAPVQATDVWVKVDLTDHDTLNESSSSSDVFKIEKIVGAAADKKVLGSFVQKTS